MIGDKNPADSIEFKASRDGDLALSRNFHLHELRCHDGTDLVKVHPALIVVLQGLSDAVREDLGHHVPIYITSGYRTPEYNKAIGGVDSSYHTKGMASDVYVANSQWDENCVAQWAMDFGAGGIGTYHPNESRSRFNHLDVGPRRTWEKS